MCTYYLSSVALLWNELFCCFDLISETFSFRFITSGSLSVCLSVDYFTNFSEHFCDIWWTDCRWVKEQLIRFWWWYRSDSFPARWLLFFFSQIHDTNRNRNLILNPRAMFSGSRTQFNLKLKWQQPCVWMWRQVAFMRFVVFDGILSVWQLSFYY